MSVKLAVMKSGEQIIADVKEMVVEGKTVGFYFYKACVVQMINPNQMDPQQPKQQSVRNKDKTAFDISLFPWIPLAKGYEIPINFESVLTLTEPVDMLYEMYEENVLLSEGEWNEGMNKTEPKDDMGCKTCR